MRKNILRYEYKYLINAFEYEVLKSRLRFLPKDSHCVNKGYYTVRSLYMEDLLGSSKFEKDSGLHTRNKFRFRTYNSSNEFVLLESKSKIGDLTQKESIKLSKESVTILINDYNQLNLTLKNCFPYLNHETFRKQFLPKVIIQYKREAYVTHDKNNLRINFDKFITSTSDTSLFLKNITNQKQITNSQNIVLEIKFTNYMPDHIKFLLSPIESSRISFSKYANSIQN